MTSGKKSIAHGVLISFLLVPSAKSLVSDDSGNPYQSIPVRNIFALKPRLVPPPPPTEQQPPVKLTLCGLTDILGRKQVLLKAQIPARPSEAAHEESYILTERQTEGDIEVLAIDQKAGTVKVNNHGKVQTLDFENNGIKLPAASSLPSASAPPGGFIPPSAAGMAQIPLRPGGIQQGGQAQGYQPGGLPPVVPGNQPGQSYQGGGAPGSQTTIGFNNPTSAGNDAAHGGPPVDYGLTGEQQSALIELERARLQEAGDHESAGLLPGTDFPQ